MSYQELPAEPVRLYVEGHHKTKGYIISVELCDVPPVRHYSNLRRARRFVERFNRIAGRAA